MHVHFKRENIFGFWIASEAYAFGAKGFCVLKMRCGRFCSLKEFGIGDFARDAK